MHRKSSVYLASLAVIRPRYPITFMTKKTDCELYLQRLVLHYGSTVRGTPLTASLPDPIFLLKARHCQKRVRRINGETIGKEGKAVSPTTQRSLAEQRRTERPTAERRSPFDQWK